MAPATTPTVVATSGPGALCAEAQADGVPCTAPGSLCEECSQARPQPVTCTCMGEGGSVRARLETGARHA
jgi:hypothetical protein